MAETLSISTPDGPFNAYVARPATEGPHPAVVVIQEIFGVNAVMRGVADAVAGQGFLAVAPDLFWRIEPGIDITDQSEAEWKRAFELYQAFDVDKGVEDIRTTLDAVRAHPGCSGKAGTVGYCLGGLLAFLAATRAGSDASVSFYGVGMENHLGEAEKLAHPLMLHIAEADSFVPPAAQARITSALKNHPQVTLHTYPGRNHAFARPGGEHFDAADAHLANDRTLQFFRTHLS